MAKIYKRPAARRDLISHYAYLLEEAGLEVAERFLAQAEETFLALGLHPRMGVAVNAKVPEFSGMRKWPIKGFQRFLVFYLPRRNGISIARVLHSSQDWRSRLRTILSNN
jgi:toxin ParE1/3/4